MKPISTIPGDESIRTQITLTTHLKRRIEQAAKPKGQSLSGYLRQAALNQLATEQTTRAQRTQLANQVIGSINLADHPEWSTLKKVIKWQKQMRKEWD